MARGIYRFLLLVSGLGPNTRSRRLPDMAGALGKKSNFDMTTSINGTRNFSQDFFSQILGAFTICHAK